MAYMDSEEAVSPVIGVILMVAVTVILAAIIASFVFGSAANIQKTKIVATTVQLDPDGSTITIMYQGGQDDGTLTSLTITAPDGIVRYISEDGIDLVLIPPTIPVKPNIGAPLKLVPLPGEVWPPDPKHVLVVGMFGDSADQVITDTYL